MEKLSSNHVHAILVVDDEPSISELLKKMLSKWGFHVDTANCLLDARNMLKCRPYSLVLTDIVMPGESGLDLLEHIHLDYPDIPVILISGHAELDMAIDAVKKGAFDFLNKPFDTHILKRRLNEAIEYFETIQQERQTRSLLEEKVIQSSMDWENTFDALTDGIVVCSTDQQILYSNLSARYMFGPIFFADPNQMVSSGDRIHPVYLNEVLSLLSFHEEKPSKADRYHEGLDMHYELISIPRVSHKGEKLGMIHVIRDVSENHKARIALLQANQEALMSSRVKSEFLANMSHELRTPMNGVIGMLTLMQKTPLTSRQHDYISMCRSSAIHILSLLNNVLDVSKMEAGMLNLDETEFGLRQSLKTTLRPLFMHLQGKAFSFTCMTQAEIPDQLFGAFGRLKQILINLVGNAIKFTEQGEIQVRVELKEKKRDRVILKFVVQDTGIGIPEDRLVVIFEPFRQADSTTTRKYGGTGLGLSIVKSLVELMGGSIQVSSQVGKGSTFCIELPFMCQTESLNDGPFLGENIWTWSVDGPLQAQAMKSDWAHPEVPADVLQAKIEATLNQLKEAILQKKLKLVEDDAQKLKEYASQADNKTLVDNAFRILLAARKGDQKLLNELSERL